MPTPKNLRIDPARPGDEEEICRLIHALATYEMAPQDCLATPEDVRNQLFGETPAAECLLARLGAKAVGFALYFTSFSTWLCRPGMYVEDLFVDPGYRSQGIGGALMQRLAAICRERDYGRMEWACLEWNETAKDFYRRRGAEPMEEWRTWRLAGEPLRSLAGETVEAGEDLFDTPAPRPPIADGDEVIVYTDGGCRPNPGVGGWAAILESRGGRKELVGGEDESTNNRMEMTAAISALEALKRPCRVILHTDSEYLRNGITKWIHAWKRKGWVRNKQGDPVKNVDLWKRLDAAIARHDVRWAWVRGHAGNEHNERCDELCTKEIDRRMGALGR